MKTVKDISWQEQQALERYTLVAPLLDESLDPAKRSTLRQKISADSGISERSLYRYEAAYKKDGFAGLKPVACERSLSKKLPSNYLEIVEQAIQLKREVPKRSVEQIIFILEEENRAAPGVLKRSTLERYLYRAGFGVKQMRMYQEARESSSKRFCKPHRMMLVQGDIKYGPYLPIGKNGAKVRTYLSSALDDHSRYLIHSRFYDNQEESIVEDTFRKVVSKAGVCDKVYFDNGSQYIARQLKHSLAKLGITIRFCPLRSGKSKGKIERFHQVVDAFVREATIDNIKTLEELNDAWATYLEVNYHQKKHEGIKEYYQSLGVEVPAEGITPSQEWNRDSRPLRFLDAAVVAEAFLHHETRKVDKGGCISFQNRKYETKAELIGFTVEISYDPLAPEIITVRHENSAPFTAKPLQITGQCDTTPAIPVSMQAAKPVSSRLLAASRKKHQKLNEQMANAISYGQFRKDGGSHV